MFQKSLELFYFFIVEEQGIGSGNANHREWELPPTGELS